MDITWRDFSGEWDGRNGGGGGRGKKKYNWEAENRQGEIKNGIGNRGLKELICTTHGHELSGGDAGGLGGQGRGWIKGKKLEKL